MRRMKEMSQTGGGMMGFGNFPEMYNVLVNTNADLATRLLETEGETQEKLIKQALDLAKIAQGLLKGEELTAFVKRSFEQLA
jgi:molecular chaperone HtpG